MKHKTQVRVESQVGFPATSMDFVHVNSKILQLIPADVVPRNKTTQLFASRFFKQSPLKHNLDLFHLFYNNLHFNVQDLLIHPQTKLKPTTIYFRHNHSSWFLLQNKDILNTKLYSLRGCINQRPLVNVLCYIICVNINHYFISKEYHNLKEFFSYISVDWNKSQSVVIHESGPYDSK